jgi:hypothetical protein
MKLWVDFNNIQNDERIEADLDFAEFFQPDALVEGSEAWLFDGTGHECKGSVVAYDPERRLVELRLDWQTWTSPATESAEVYVQGFVPRLSGQILEPVS